MDYFVDALIMDAVWFYVSADYLLGLTENKNHSDADLQSLHPSDDVVALLRSGKLNHRLLCERATHPMLRRLMADIEINVDRIADMRVPAINTVMKAIRQKFIENSTQDEDDLHIRALALTQIQESDYDVT